MEFSLLWTFASIVVYNAWKVHGILPVPVLQFKEHIIADEDTTITCSLPYSHSQDAELFIKMNNVSLTDCDQEKGDYPNVTCTVEVNRDMHEKEFICEALFKSQSKPTKMMLQTEPEFTDCPEKLVWIVGQETSFHCKADGYPPPSVTCEKNRRIHKEGETFTAEQNMSGNYICKARNFDIVSKTVTVSLEYKPNILDIKVNPDLHGEGDEVKLTCEADGLPEPTYSWNVPSSNVTFSSDNQTVTVQSLRENQLGNYTCTVHNPHGTATKGRVLDLAVKPKILKITAQPSFQVLEGENVTLTCEVSGFPPAGIEWDTPKANIEKSKDGKTIRIWGVTKNHVGDYRCKAQNTYGIDTQVKQLTLGVKAKVTQIKVQPPVPIEEGSNVTLTCVAEGVPPPTLSWVPPTSNVQYSADNSVINIWGAAKMHDGIYLCKAENKYGVHNSTKQISIKSVPGGKGNSRERRETVFVTFLAMLTSMSLFYYLF